MASTHRRTRRARKQDDVEHWIHQLVEAHFGAPLRLRLGSAGQHEFQQYRSAILQELLAQPETVTAAKENPLSRDVLRDTLDGYCEWLALRNWHDKLPAVQAAHLFLHPHEINACLNAASAYEAAVGRHDHRDLTARAGPPPKDLDLPEARDVRAAARAMLGLSSSSSMPWGQASNMVGILQRPSIQFSLGLHVLKLDPPRFGGGVTSVSQRCVELYEALLPAWDAADGTRQNKCLFRFSIAAKTAAAAPEKRDDPSFWNADQYLRLLQTPPASTERSLLKPEIARRHAPMYFPGGTKEQWEKAQRAF
ncbi:hypothetical protein JCM10213_008092 [Rhodosporidiobolus nylandii]